jgi:outer membrane protein
MRKIYSATLCVMLVSTLAAAQEVMRLSMAECMDYAMKHNNTVRNAAIDVLIQDAQNRQTLSASRPHINAKAEIDDMNVPQKTFMEAKNFYPNAADGDIAAVAFSLPYTASVGATATQLVFDGAVFIALKARKSVLELAKSNEKATQESIRYNVFKAYNSLIIAYRQFDIVKNSLGFARSLERDLEITRKNGFAEKIDVERTSVQVNNLATDSIRIANLLTVSEDVLKFQMGLGMDKSIVLTDTALEQHKNDALALLAEEKSYERIPEYNIASTALKLSEYNLKRYKYSALPTVNVFWGTGFNYGSNKFEGVFNKLYKYEYNSAFGLQINLPIYNGGLRLQQVRETQLNIEKSNNNISLIKESIDFQVALSRTTLRNALLQVQSQKRNMELADDVLDLAQKKFKAGVGSNLEITQAQTDQLRAQNGYFSALLDVTNAEADLRKALGLLK